MCRDVSPQADGALAVPLLEDLWGKGVLEPPKNYPVPIQPRAHTGESQGKENSWKGPKCGGWGGGAEWKGNKGTVS